MNLSERGTHTDRSQNRVGGTVSAAYTPSGAAVAILRAKQCQHVVLSLPPLPLQSYYQHAILRYVIHKYILYILAINWFYMLRNEFRNIVSHN